MTNPIDTTELANLAGVTFDEFKSSYSSGHNVATDYYNELALQGSITGNQNTEDYGNLAGGVTTNSGLNGKIANGYSESVAYDKGIDFSIGSDNWLRMQYELMRNDYGAREASVVNGGSGELDYKQTNEIHADAFKAVGLPPETFTLYVPTHNLGEVDPEKGQNLFENAIHNDGPLDGLLTEGIRIDVMNDLAGTTNLDYWNWIGHVLRGAASDPVGVLGAGLGGELQDVMAPVGGAVAPWFLDHLLDPLIPDWVPQALEPLQYVPGYTHSPLVIDVNRSGTIDLVNVDSSSVRFDFWGDGFKEVTGWVAPEDGLLVYDVNGNGLIENVSEMFGSNYPLNYAIDEHLVFSKENGFAKLAALDSNQDGLIDAHDVLFSHLQVWQDLDQDGVSQANELFTLFDLGIESIDVANAQIDSWGGTPASFQRIVEGNSITHTSTVTFSDGGTSEIVDAWFANDLQNTSYYEDYDFDLRTPFLLNLRGYGNLPDLNVAMSNNEDLLNKVASFSLGQNLTGIFDNFDTIRQDVQDILFSWADAHGQTEIYKYGLFSTMPEYEFLRSFTGMDSDYLRTWFDGSRYLPIVHEGVSAIYQAWDNVLDSYVARFVFQSGGSDLFSGTTYDWTTDTFTGDLTLSQSAISSLETEAVSQTDVEGFWRSIVSFIDNVKGLDQLTAGEQTWVNDAIDTSTSGAYDLLSIAATLDVNVIDGTSGADTINGTRFNDEIHGYGGSDTLYGGAGNDLLDASWSSDSNTLIGGSGNDILIGGSGDDTYIYDSGNDVIVETVNTSTSHLNVIDMGSGIGVDDVSLYLARVDAMTYATTEHLVLDVAGRGKIIIEDEEDNFPVADMIDEIHFEDGAVLNLRDMDVTIYGSDKSDDLNTLSFGFDNTKLTILGGGGDDHVAHNVDTPLVFDGGAGNDTVFSGYYQDDVYIASPGTDTITDIGGSDVIKVPEGYTESDVHFYRTNILSTSGGFDDAEIVIDGLGSILLPQHIATISTGRGIETLEYSDGSTVDLKQVPFITKGTDGNDVMGSASVDFGWPNADEVYLFGKGQDVVVDSDGTNVILFGEGYSADNITIEQHDDLYGSYHNDLLITDMNGNSLRLDGYFSLSPSVTDYLQFSDGSTLQLTDIEIETHGSDAIDNLNGIENRDLSNNDVIYGYGGADSINAKSGDDIIIGGEGNDAITGGDGFDISVYTGLFADYTITPQLTSYYVEDTVGTDGRDSISQIERLNFQDGFYDLSTSTFTPYDEVFVATATAESFAGDNEGTDTVDYSNSDAAVSVDIKDNILSGGYAEGDSLSGIEAIVGSAYDDLIKGDNGINTINGGAGDDQIYGRDGDDTLLGGDGADKMRGGDGNDVIYTGAGDDTDVRGEAGNDTIYGEDGADKLQGSEGDDTLYGGDGNDLLYGDDTDELLTGNDILDGGAGDDSLRGGYGDDTYIASAGLDDIFDLGGNDKIVFGSGVGLFDLGIQIDPQDSDSVLITNGADTIKVVNQLDVNSAVETLVFDDGSHATLSRVGDWIYASGSGGTTHGFFGDDTVLGSAGNDVLNGLGGNDELFGGAGDDVLRGGAGDDLIHGGDGANDIAWFSGDYSNYVISGNTVEDTVGSDGTDTLFGIEKLYFYDGSYENGVFTASAADDVLVGTVAADILDGRMGSDTADYSGSTYGVSIDLLNGTASGGVANRDTLISIENLIGTAAADTLAGDMNNNALSGGLGDDTYIHRGGLDTITDTGGTDTLVLANANIEDASFAFDGNDLLITINVGLDEVRLVDHVISSSTIETIQFADGFTADLADVGNWVLASASVNGSDGVNDTIIFGTADDTSYGYDGNDHLYGYDGADTLSGMAGDDVLFGGSGFDTLYGDDGNDILDGGSGVDKLRGGAGDDTIYGGDGNETDMRGEEGNDHLYGGNGDDTIYGDYNSSDTMAGNDTLDGGTGDDTLRGGLGDDIYLASDGHDYIYDRGGNDRIHFGDGVSIFDISSAADPADTNDQIITWDINSITIENQTDAPYDLSIETLEFSDGTYATYANILDWTYATAAGGTIQGSYSLDDTMIGNVGDDSFYGKDGNDQLFGGAGNDYLRGDNGNDLLVGGNGDDDMKGDAGDDIFYAGPGADRMEGHDGADTFILQGIETIDGNLNRVVDFSHAEGDRIVLKDILQGYDPLTDAITDYITMHTTSHTYLSIDIDGKGDTYGMASDVIRIENNISWSSVQDMIDQGDLMVAA